MASPGQYGGWRGRGRGRGRGGGNWRQHDNRGAKSLSDLSSDFSPGRKLVDRNWRRREPETEMCYLEGQGALHGESQRELYGGRRGGRNEKGKRNWGGSEMSDSYYTRDVRYQNNKRQYPIGRKQLQQLMEVQADVIVLELLREQSGYQVFLQEDSVHSENLLLLITVLSRACSTKSNKVNLNELFNMTCEQKFMDKLCAFTMTVKRNYPDRASTFFHDLHTFLDTYAKAMITNAIDRITDLIDACISVLTALQLKGIVSQDLIVKYESLQNMLEESKEKWNRSRNLGKQDQRGHMMDEMQPPNDFRELPVIPVPYDLCTMERPFLRRNIVEGKYQDEEHYLDVQFRLLREDFVRPLRNGIHDFRAGNKKVRDVRIYRDVEIIGSEIKRKRMIHLIQLNLPKKFMVENSKRLLYGNLLCFTNDNFQTMFLASVAERDSEMAKNGIIGVTLETDITDFDLSGRFLMVESRAYFMAYKHVLQSLKDKSSTGVPLTSYIIHVNSIVKPPNYLKVDSHYNLQVVKEKKMMKMSEAHNKLFELLTPEDSITADSRYPELSHIPMYHGLESWPSSLELGLDKSQHRALHGALTHELSIIQGPPGTGKTFIGLKITQILLHNSEVWKNENHPTPILVVCFTNHALDQFLEGMTTYTQSIVRVGSRSKNEAINKFQVNNLVRYLQSSRRIPGTIHDRNRILYNDTQDIENEIRNLRAIVHSCKHPEGVLSLDTFLQEFIIPEHLSQQLIKGKQQMLNWLLFNMQGSVDENSMKKLDSQNEIDCSYDSTSGSNEDNVQSGQVDEDGEKLSDEDSDDRDIFEDAEELLQQEELNRRLDEEDYQELVDKPVKLSYEITFGELNEQMRKLKNRDRDPKEYFSYTILEDQRRALAIGLDLKERPLEMENLEKMNINLWNLDFPTRWTLYKYWLSQLREKISKKVIKLEGEYKKKTDALQEIKQQEYLYIMRHASIVGMTTTGAAQYSNVMQDLAPAIVIIEEAAEILESHVVASLTSSCQHLILIGDHQQLRPSATVFELATKYGLETSLFERMIKNGLNYECLEYQHRMRPTISKLLVPTIYPHLKDDTSVTLYPHVKGIAKDIFFISHQIYEREEADDNNSHENIHEAQFIIALCRHLMLQGYDANDVTILTPYSGQFFLLKKLQREHPVCSGVRICVVDNFQGEENKIILLSLVRSNVDGKVGFLRTDNRVCVALSRAKEGLYITGNMDLLCASSKLWQDIKKDLEAEGNIGSALPLKCENHFEIQEVTTGEEFFTKSPEGGCFHLCNKSLPRCDHLCPKVCHMDDVDHNMYKCREPCPKVLCSLDHPCPKKCWEVCEPCQVKVQKTLPCSHVHNIPCYIDPEKYRCPTPVNKVLPDCQHEVIMPCHAKPERWTCPMDCDTRLDCGHMCRQKCHVREDPEHRKYDCLQSCTRLNAGCTQNHPCQKKCYEDCGSCVKEVSKVLPCGHTVNKVQCHISPEKVQCNEKCKRTLSCGHACKNLCHKPCGNCPVKVKKIIPSCQHTIWIECSEEATTDKCDGACPKSLSCGHPCLERCNQTCTSKCPAKITSDAKCPKNHSLLIPCYLEGTTVGEDTWIHCNKPCDQMLDCGHKCQGKCGHCFQGRVHEACKKPCNKSLVCGHICKHPCGANCPPCQQECEWRCKHSKCKKLCGIPCTECKEQCQRKCSHGKCNNFCGSKCTRDPCDKPCEKKLKCDHPCVGFCGEPCPPLCRTCDADKLTDFILLGFEDDDDARFVLLEDCGHCIEVQGLEGWLHQNETEIGMKTCPRCRKPIYNSSRYKNIVLETYKTVKAVKEKYFSRRTLTKRKEVEVILAELSVYKSDNYFSPQIRQLLKKLGMGSSKKQRQKQLNDSELQLAYFQAVVLKKAKEILLKSEVYMGGSPLVQIAGTKKNKSLEKLKPMVELVVDRVMQRSQIIPPQMVEEISCELQRLMILPSYWNVLEKKGVLNNDSLSEIVAKLEKIMDPTIKYDSITEKKVTELLEESKNYVGGLGISNSERIMIVQAMGLKQGHWYKCPNGHVYCITECGGAQQKSKCPDCKASIGGLSYRLEAGNTVAGEMDGATYAAWSNQFNLANVGNI